ncbi:hypothetical protein A8C32_01730 [Flavivirga aquatica]|uniref:Uncharacterized protein n=1 Tax=Flavivirga aquatica TaxID=1849968 RepID=A0A1E5T9Z6_9FLAO|nr:hypothetical protein [Flavivirga aquatica]OEK08210.1 hypothetical protein A8C32_01730 [Flavivirga aquatica]
MAKRATPWKEGKVISIETRKGVFVIAQMLKRPYLRFYNAFREDENWGKVDVSIFDTLFTKGITTKSFLKHSNVSVVKDAIPDTDREDSKTWIKGYSGNRKVKVWEGTEDEEEFYILGSEVGGSLVDRDIYKSGGYDHSSGLFDKIIIEDIPLNADDIIDNHETMGLGVFPLTNERLYQCYKAGKNVDPTKDLKFNREIPKDYKIAIEIMSGGGGKENKERILDTYFR